MCPCGRCQQYVIANRAQSRRPEDSVAGQQAQCLTHQNPGGGRRVQQFPMALCLNEQTLAVRPVGPGARTSPELLKGDRRKKGKCVTAVAETQVLRRARRPGDPHIRVGDNPHLRRRRFKWGGGWVVSGDRNVLKLFGAERRTSRSLRAQTRSSSSRSITSVSVSSLRYSRACSSLAASMFNVLRTFRPIAESPVSCAYNMHTVSVSRTRGQENADPSHP